LPGRAGEYAVVVYDPKSDGKILAALTCAESGTFALDAPDLQVAYWLENLELPGATTLQRVMSSLIRRKPDRQDGAKGAGASGGSRVDRFIASLPEFRATGPGTRMRFLESFAMQLECELDSAAQPGREAPRWVSCEERYPRAAGKYGVVVDRPRESLVLAALAFDGRTFSSPVEETSVHFWLEGLEMPPFYRFSQGRTA
jgi:hypothetical protein